jgi:hypothetical protein
MRLGRSAADVDRPPRAGGSESVETTTIAPVSDRVLTVGKGILVAVVVLIVLGELYATGIVATPAKEHSPTNRVVNETHAGVAAGAVVQLDVSADHYYDNGTHAEVVWNATTDTQLTEGTDYEFYPNGSVENLDTSSTDLNVTYSYYNQSEFQAMTDTFASYGTTAFTMLGLGLIAAGAAAALAYFGRFGGGSR